MTERPTRKDSIDRRSLLKISGITALVAGLGFGLRRRLVEAGGDIAISGGRSPINPGGWVSATPDSP